MANQGLPGNIGTIQSDETKGSIDPHSVAQPGDRVMAAAQDTLDIMTSVMPGIAAGGLERANNLTTTDNGAVEVQQIRVANTGDPVADDALNTIWALEDGIDQNVGSKRQAMELELARNLERAQGAFPWLKPQLAQQQARFKQSSPDLMMLDMFEKQAVAQNKANAKDIDRIKDYAENSLGMSPVGFGTSSWGREFARRDHDVQLRTTNEQILAAQESNQDLEITSVLRSYKDKQDGRASSTTATFNKYREGLATYHLAIQDVTQPRAKEVVNAWNNGGKQALANAVRADIYADQQAFGDIDSRFWDQTKYQDARSAHETHIGMLEDLITGIEQDNPTLTQGYELYATAQSIGFEQENRDVVAMARQAKVWAPVMELGMNTFDGRGQLTAHTYGVIANDLIMALAGEDIALSTGIPDTARDAATLREEYSSEVAGVADILGNGASSREERQTDYIENIVQKNTSAYLALAGDDELAPHRAKDMIRARGVLMVGVNQSGPLDQTGQQVLLESFANPDILKVAELGKELDPNAAGVLASDLLRVQHNYDVARVNNYIDNLNQTPMKFGSFAVHQNKFLKPNFNDIENGNVTFTVDDKAAWDFVREQEPSISWTHIKSMVANMKIHAASLGKQVSLDLKWLAHVEALHNGTNVADYERQYDLSFADMRMPREEDGQSNTN